LKPQNTPCIITNENSNMHVNKNILLMQWVKRIFIFLMVVFFIFRCITAILFIPPQFSLGQLLGSFLLGLVYDTKWIAIACLPILLLGYIKPFHAYHNNIARWWWIVYITLISFFYIFMFGGDFGHFAYVGTRLNASGLNFFEDPDEMVGMLFQTYPMPLIITALVIAILCMIWLYNKWYKKIITKYSNHKNFPLRFGWMVLLMSFFVYGKPWYKPLQRSDAMKVFTNKFNAYLALNPMQNFFTTLSFRKPMKNVAGLDKHATFMASYFNKMPPYNNIERSEVYNPLKTDTPKNIVVVLCESLSMYKTSMSGNVLNPTPYMDSLAKQSIFFNRCFTPHFGTARGLFALTTGIPDVQLSKFSSRNEEVVNGKPCLLNALEGYNQYYFLGGSASFNNFKGIINNINNVNIIERGAFNVPDVTTWGISDKQLFIAAHKKFEQSAKPFAAIIQTSQNHRPFAVSKDDAACTFNNYEKKVLQQNGFTEQAEYNAMKLFDFSVEHFITLARTAPYFKNTLFVFIGDHGVPGNATATYPSAWTQEKLGEEHVPLLFYAPWLQAQQRNEVVSQIDVLPTALSICGQSYTNKTMGRNLLSPLKKGNYAFIIYHDEGDYGIVTDSTYYIKSTDFAKEHMVSTLNNKPINKEGSKQAMQQLSAVADSYLSIARWCLVNVKD
jgi:phosphoglycerol transferase MdoB-like AlkP superfamily enzyme